MKRRKNVIKLQIFILILLCVFLTIFLIYRNRNPFSGKVYSEDYVSLEEVQSELAFTVYTPEEWEEHFASYNKEYLTKDGLQQLLDKLGVDTYILADGVHTTVTRSEWNEIYQQLISFLDTTESVTTQTILVLDTMEAEKENVLITNQEDFFTPLPATYFENWKAYDVYCINNKCIGMIGVSQSENIIQNAYLKSYGEERATFLFAGSVYEIEVPKIDEIPTPGVCDFVFVDGSLSTIRQKTEVIEGKLLSYDNEMIEIEGYGKISHSGKLPVYQLTEDVFEKSISDVVLGNMDVEYITGDEQICAIIMKNNAVIENIRVLLLGEDGSKFRSDLWLKCDTNAKINYNEQVVDISANAVIPVADYGLDGQFTLSVVPETAEGRIYLCNEVGENISNGYYGTMEVRNYPEGYSLVNSVPFERYLYAVVPSEMPSNYQPEALKAQAVCARSYAYMQLMRADLAAYGAHINDSTSYQVYNKVAQSEASIAAVEATKGQVMMYQGNVIEAYYFSTSMGYTDTAAVWNAADNPVYGYLKSASLLEVLYEGDLSTEEGFEDYISNQQAGYDSEIKFYRWQARANYQDKTAQINEILENRRSVSKDNVIYYETDGVTQVEEMDNFGKLLALSVKERSSAGSILTLLLQYKNGYVEVKSEYNIRKVLGAGLSSITFMDDSVNETMTILPSAFCTVSPQEDGSYLLLGGGYGHGLGMSQNGANGLAKAGYLYEDILKFFYNEISIEEI